MASPAVSDMLVGNKTAIFVSGRKLRQNLSNYKSDYGPPAGRTYDRTMRILVRQQ